MQAGDHHRQIRHSLAKGIAGQLTINCAAGASEARGLSPQPPFRERRGGAGAARPPDLGDIALLTVEPSQTSAPPFFQKKIRHEARYYGQEPRPTRLPTLREKGICTSNRTIRIDQLETGVTARAAVVARRIANLVREYSAERAKLLAEDRRQRGELARRLSQLGHRIRRLLEAIADGTATRAIHEQLIAEEAELAKLGQELAWLEARARTVIELQHRAIAQYQERVAALTEALRDAGPDREPALTTLRRLIGRIEVVPLPARGQVALTAHGLIAGLVDYATRKQAANDSAISMVAGEGFEPPTLGL